MGTQNTPKTGLPGISIPRTRLKATLAHPASLPRTQPPKFDRLRRLQGSYPRKWRCRLFMEPQTPNQTPNLTPSQRLLDLMRQWDLCTTLALNGYRIGPSKPYTREAMAKLKEVHTEIVELLQNNPAVLVWEPVNPETPVPAPEPDLPLEQRHRIRRKLIDLSLRNLDQFLETNNVAHLTSAMFLRRKLAKFDRIFPAPRPQGSPR